MLVLTKENIIDYVKQKYKEFEDSTDFVVSKVGDDVETKDGDGFVNSVFRVSNDKKKIILKQGLPHSRKLTINDLPTDRGKWECDALKIYHSLTPEYVPELIFYDAKNSVIAEEDISHLPISRYALCDGTKLESLSKNIAEFLAKTHFYTSEYYLDVITYRELREHFSIPKMKSLFDGMLFRATKEDIETVAPEKSIAYNKAIQTLLYDEEVINSKYELRRKYTFDTECFMHGDLHTSNIFTDGKDVKIIDMEYASYGPIGYDLGYFLANLWSQYVTCRYRFTNDKERTEFKKYLVETILRTFGNYTQLFLHYLKEDGKVTYKNIHYVKEFIFNDIKDYTIGYCAVANFSRILIDMTFADYHIPIKNEKDIFRALATSALMDSVMLKKMHKYSCMKEWAMDMIDVEESAYNMFKNFN